MWSSSRTLKTSPSKPSKPTQNPTSKKLTCTHFPFSLQYRLLEKVKQLMGEDKDSKVQQNLLINDYYEKKANNPHKLLNDLIALAPDVQRRVSQC